MATCSICGKDASDSQLTGGICDGCLAGPPAITKRPSPPMPKHEPPVEFDGEEALFRDDSLVVTPTRCILPVRTFFTNSITAVEIRSVKVGGSSPLNVAGAIVFFIMAGLALLWLFDPAYGTLGVVTSAACFLVAMFFLYRTTANRPTAEAWSVIAFTSVGPIEVTRSIDRGSCERVASVLNRTRQA